MHILSRTGEAKAVATCAGGNCLRRLEPIPWRAADVSSSTKAYFVLKLLGATLRRPTQLARRRS
jgi:hypothetical protein